MGICYCCLDEGAKVERVLDKFPAMPGSQAQDNMLCKVVGRCVLAGQAPFYSPGTMSPCVWFKVVVEKERIERRRDEEGRMREYRSWVHVCTEERFQDFYIQDGAHKVFINGANRGLCRIQGMTDAAGRSGHSFFDQPPIGIRMLLAARDLPDFRGRSRDTGRYRFRESKFEVNELVAALGVPTPAVDPYTQQPVKILNPFTEASLPEEMQERLGFDDWDKRAWADLLTHPAVLLSDNAKFTAGVAVTPIMNLPPWMTTFDQARCTPQMYGAAPGMQVPMG